MLKRGFVLEALSLYIPGLVGTDELERVAGLLSGVDNKIFFTILSFFPEYKMKNFESPGVEDMVESYRRVKATGLQNVLLGNIGIFTPTEKEQDYLKANIDNQDSI